MKAKKSTTMSVKETKNVKRIIRNTGTPNISIKISDKNRDLGEDLKDVRAYVLIYADKSGKGETTLVAGGPSDVHHILSEMPRLATTCMHDLYNTVLEEAKKYENVSKNKKRK